MNTFDFLILFMICIVGLMAQGPDEGYSREQLQPLTNFRQQHRRTIDGRLCAAAFVQNRKSYTGCTDAPNPSGESGRPWCYVEAQDMTYCFRYCARVMYAVLNAFHSCWDPMQGRQHGTIAVRPAFSVNAMSSRSL